MIHQFYKEWLNTFFFPVVPSTYYYSEQRFHFFINMRFFPFSPKFGKVISLQNKDQFLDAVDKENPNVIVVVHLYSEVTSF